MKRRYKLLIIILLGTALAFIISMNRPKEKTSLTAIGDGLSLGMTPYKIPGTSFNDYLKELLENKKDLENYNNEFTKLHLRIKDLNDYLDKNILGKYTKLPLKQIIDKSDIVTLAIGLDEFAENSLLENITTETIDIYIKEMDKFLSAVREFYNKKIIVVGLYPANNFTKKDAIEVNENLKKLCGKYNASFIDIISISQKEEYYLDQNSYYMNYLAHKKIAKYLYQIYKTK